MTTLKKVMKISLLLFLLFIITLVIVSRLKGFGIKTHDGRYIGYFPLGKEWVFHDYRNYPVLEDGPYVFKDEGEQFALYIRGNGKESSEVIREAVKSKIEVHLDSDKATSFTVPLRQNHSRSELNVKAPGNVLALSDFEGEFEAFVELLKGSGVIDDSLNWQYGDGHLVLVGDMVDRGINVVPLLWLIYKLEAEAESFGGRVHYVLGNHERYLLDGRIKSAARKYQGSARLTDLSPSALWSEKTELGQWLRSKPVLLKSMMFCLFMVVLLRAYCLKI